MEAPSIVLTIILISIFFAYCLLLLHFLKYRNLLINLKYLDDKRKNNGFQNNKNNNISEIIQNTYIKDHNDIEKAILKNNKVFDISSFEPASNFHIFESFSFEEIMKKIEENLKKYINDKEFSHKSNKLSENIQNRSSFNKMKWLLKQDIINCNNIFSLFNLSRQNVFITKKPILIILCFYFVMNILVHILALQYNSFDIKKQVEIMFFIPFCCLPLIFLKQCFENSLHYQLYYNFEISSKHHIYFWIQNNVFFLLYVFSLGIIQIDWDAPYSHGSTCFLLIPSLLIDFLFIRNALIVIFMLTFYLIEIIKNGKNLSVIIEEKIKKMEIKQQNDINFETFIDCLKNEAPSQIISKIEFKKKNDETDIFVNCNYANNNISLELPKIKLLENEKMFSFRNNEKKNNKNEIFDTPPKLRRKKNLLKKNNFSEKIPCKLLSKINIFERNIASDRKDFQILDKNSKNSKINRYKQSPKNEDKKSLIKKNQYSRQNFQSEKPNKTKSIFSVWNLNDFRSSKQNHNFYLDDGLEKNSQNTSENSPITEKNLDFILNSNFLEDNKENLPFQEKNQELSFLEKIYLEKKSLKFKNNLNEQNEKKVQDPPISFEPDFLEKITTENLNKKAKERKINHRLNFFLK